MTSGPYKSKTLNFISEKHRQILDRGDRAFRHLKVAASNTVQLLLYPMYVLLQASRLAVKQIQQKVVKHIPQFQGKVKKKAQNNQTADKSIQQILEAAPETSVAQVCNIGATKAKEDEQPSPPNIQQPKISSISTSQTAPQSKFVSFLKWEEKSNSTPDIRLENKNLILVGKDCQKMDNLTSAKQQQLQQRLIQETTNIDQKAQLQLKPSAELAPNFRPIGKFWEVMAWVQTSKIALWFNLFGEVNLLSPTNELHQPPFGSLGQTPPLLPSSNFTFRDFIHNSAKQYLYPLTTGLGLNGLLPPFDVEKLPLDYILEEELGQELEQMRSQSVASTVSLYQPKTSESRIDLCEAPINLAKISTNKTSSEISPQAQTANPKPKHQPNWLEVKSISIGYIKHPLEEILAWVDMIMSWLEIAIVRIGQWAQKQWQNF